MPSFSQWELLPVSDVDTGWTPIGGGGTRYEVIDRGFVVPDDTDYITTTTDLAIQTVRVEGIYCDSATFVQGKYRAANSGKWSDDTHDIRVRVLEPDGTQISTNTQGIASTTPADFACTVTAVTFDKTQTDGIQVEFRFDRTVVGANDSAGLEVYEATVEIDYELGDIFVT